MFTVETYLRQQYAGGVGPSMESNLKPMFGEFKLPDIFSAGSIPKAPWNDATLREFSDELLLQATYRDVGKGLSLPVTPWLYTTKDGKLTIENVFFALSTELGQYRHLVDTFGLPVVSNYLKWACRATTALDQSDMDTVYAGRATTLAEALQGLSYGFLGMRSDKLLVETVPFRGDVLSTFKIQQRPDFGLSVYAFQLSAETATELIRYSKLFDAFADRMDNWFSTIHEKSAGLKSFRELLRSDEPHHPLYQFLDSEMLVPFNMGLGCALFNRSRSIADHLRMLVYTATH